MSVHVLLDSVFFAASLPVADQQRVLLVPSNKGLHVGDTVFLRNAEGDLTWVADVLAVGEVDGPEAWNSEEPVERQRHALLGYLARIHPGVLPRGTSRLSARWVTLNRRTLAGTLPWWETGVLIYHSTLRLIEGLLSPEEAQKALELGYLSRHPSGHWVIPHGEARKRILVHVLGHELVCGLCGGPIAALEEATQDHIIPVSQGGPDALANVQLAHRSCNELKGNALPEQYPPFFPRPGNEAAGWYERSGRRSRNGRGGRFGRHQRGYGGAPAAAFQAQPRDLPGTVAGRHQDAPAEPAPADGHAEAGVPAAETAVTAPAGAQAHHEAAAAPEQLAREPVREDPAWLAAVQSADLQQLQVLSREPNWATRTASLRTLEQLPRARASAARGQGTLLAEASGPKGLFRLLEWQGEHVLMEERGRRQTLHLVKMVHAVTPQAYVWYLSRFGRTSPLAVAMALLPLWQKGAPDKHGRLPVSKSGQQFVIVIQDHRVTDCAEELSLAS
ncbi:MAG TPA: HNH endonuclease signature motif containing protein [Limnochordales bacterium]